MQSFLLAFIPLFVAIDPVGVLPMFVGLTEGYSIGERRRLALHATLTAFFVGTSFGLIGHYIFTFLGITPADFKIAGGLLLMIFSIREMFGESPKLTGATHHDNMIAVVPIGIPLIAGPAFITTLLILHDLYSLITILAAMTANLVLTLLLFTYSDVIVRKTGQAFAKMLAKVVAIFLAAIGVMMIRKGLEAILQR